MSEKFDFGGDAQSALIDLIRAKFLFTPNTDPSPNSASPFSELLGALIQGPGSSNKDPDAHYPILDRAKKRHEETSEKLPFRPAIMTEVMSFLQGVTELKIGDKVKIREGYNLEKWPSCNDTLIISRIITPALTPINGGAEVGGSSIPYGHHFDTAVLHVENLDYEMLELFGIDETPRIVEILFDSRRLTKIGNIFEEVKA